MQGAPMFGGATSPAYKSHDGIGNDSMLYRQSNNFVGV